MALSLLCGGLGVATATDVVHVNESATGTAEVYTKAGVDTLLEGKADKTALENKANATDVATNKANIDKNEENITKLENDKLRIDVASATYATKDALDGLTTVVNGKADAADVNNKLANKADAAALDGKANKADVYSKTDADTTFATKTELNAKADTTALGEYAKTADVNNALNAKANKTDLDTANGKITDLQAKTAKLSADGTKLTDMTTVSGTTVSGTNVEAGALKVTGEISNGAGVTTTLADIKDSMDRTDMNKTWIGKLNAKTTNITHDATGTSVDGVTFNAGAVTGVKSINGTEIGEKESGEYIHQDNSIWGNMKKVDTQVKTNADNIETNKNDITKLDAKVGTVGTGDYLDPIKSVGDNLGLLDAGLKKEVGDRTAAVEAEKTAREAEDTNLSNRIGTVTEDGTYIKKSTTNNVSENLKVLDTQAKTNTDAIAKETADREAAIGELAVNGNYIEKDKNVSDNLVELDKQAKTNADAITKTNQRTAGITRDDTKKETSIEGRVTVDTNGNIKAEGTITSNGLDARAGEIKTTGKVSAGDVSTGTLETTGNAKIGGDLTVNGKLNVGEIYMEHKKQESTGKDYDSATAITADGISNRAKVTDENGNTTESQFTHNEKGMFNYAKDEKITGDKNTHTYSQTAAETKEQLVNGDKSNFEKKTAEGNTISIKDKDAAGNPKSLTNKQTVDGEKTSVTNNESSSTINQGADQIRHNVTSADGKKSSIEVKAEGITNTSKDGTITNDAKDIVNNATGNMTNTVGGDLTTTVGGNELHEVTGTKTENVTGKVTENYKAGQETNVTGNQDIHVTGKQTNKIDGDQENTIGGNQTTNVTGDISNTAKNITNEATTKLTDKVGANTRVLDGEGITDTVGGSTLKSRVTQKKGSIETVVTDGTSFNHSRDIPVASTKTLTGYGKMNQLLDDLNSSTKTITDGTHKTSKVQTALDITNTAADGTITNDAKNIVNNASGDMTNTVGGKLTTTVTGATEENYNGGLTTNVTGEENHTVTGKQNNKVTGKQTNTVEGGQENIISGGQTNTITGGQINNITGDQTTTITGNKTETVTENVTEDYQKNLTTTVGGNEIHDVKGTKTETVEGKVTENFKGGQETNVTGNQDIHVTGKQTNKIDGNQENTIGGDQTTNVTGDILNTAENITNEAKTSLTDKVGNNTRVTTSRSITDTVGATTNRMIEDGKITDHAGDFTVTTDEENGTTFTNAGSTASSFTTVDGRDTGSARGSTNIKGNEISTGKVEANYVKMDYADVMNDLGVKGTTTTKTLKVTENATVGGTLDVTQKATFHDDVDIKKNLSVDGNATIKGDVTAKSYKVGRNTYIDENGINANNQKITNVADGSISEGSKDAVNGGQLYGVKRDLEHQVDKVGANAAAMANLRPMEFDPSSKWNIAAAIGNYGSETAAAIGAFYRPNDNVMVNLSTAFGTGENMVGGGVSVRLGKGGNKLSREENNALKDQVNDLTARMDALLSVLNPNMSKDFPDVPENHWAYEAVSRLAGNDIVQGYPDGEFHGERTMTRYEMAEIIYNALSRGAEAEKELVEEFKPELQAMAASEKATAEKAEG